MCSLPPVRLFAEMHAEIVPRRVRQADYSHERGLISTFGELAVQSHRNMHHGNGRGKETEFANCPSCANWLMYHRLYAFAKYFFSVKMKSLFHTIIVNIQLPCLTVIINFDSTILTLMQRNYKLCMLQGSSSSKLGQGVPAVN